MKTSPKDHFSFVSSIWSSSVRIGAITPSSKSLAKEMVKSLAPTPHMKVLELGPGTGIFTSALIEAGIAEENLTLIEFNPKFQALLEKRFPKATLLKTDAFAYASTLASQGKPSFCGIISGLPLFSFPKQKRVQLGRDLQHIVSEGGRYVQFTYHIKKPIKNLEGWRVSKSRRVWRNTPPAVVWTYERAAST